MNQGLVVIAEGQVMGEIHRTNNARLTFRYDDDWRATRHAYPLSLSMPLVADHHEHEVVEPWLWGLLPDNEVILARWAQRFQVSARNAFALISNVGEDCPGAIQIVPSEKVDGLQGRSAGAIDWLTEHDIAERLRGLRKDQSAWRIAKDTGQFSLAGAQPKTAFYGDGKRWGVPSGRVPTTHIFKPPIAAFDGHAENEHVCLLLARMLGLPAASSTVHRFEDEIAIVVDRYDRLRQDDVVLRLHQEDMCQTLGLPPTKKYENEGGPGVVPIVDVLRTHSQRPTEDIETFVKTVALNWVIGGTDAHAKNYSVLIGGGGQTRLAPLYDVASILPYDVDHKQRRLAMKIGGKYYLDEIAARHWSKLAKSAKLSDEDVLGHCQYIIDRLPDALSDAIQEARGEGLNHPILGRLGDVMNARVKHCRFMLERRPSDSAE